VLQSRIGRIQQTPRTHARLPPGHTHEQLRQGSIRTRLLRLELSQQAGDRLMGTGDIGIRRHDGEGVACEACRDIGQAQQAAQLMCHQ